MNELNFKIEDVAKIIQRKFPLGIDLVNAKLMNRDEAVLFHDGGTNFCYAVFASNQMAVYVDFFKSNTISIERIENDWIEFSLEFSFNFLDDIATVINRLR